MGLHIIWPMQDYSYSWIEVYPPLEHLSGTQEWLETGIDSGPQKRSGSPKRRMLVKAKTKTKIAPLPVHTDPISQEDDCFPVTQKSPSLCWTWAMPMLSMRKSPHSPTELINCQGQLQNWLHGVCGQSHIAGHPLLSRILSSWVPCKRKMSQWLTRPKTIIGRKTIYVCIDLGRWH